MLNDVNSKINVVKAYDAQLDAWKGGAKLAKEKFNSRENLEQFCISRAMYDECGHHYL